MITAIREIHIFIDSKNLMQNIKKVGIRIEISVSWNLFGLIWTKSLHWKINFWKIYKPN